VSGASQPAAESDDCLSCGENPDEKCPRSQRSCGHHCNHSWTHDACDWCGVEWGENGVPTYPSEGATMIASQIARVVHEANRALQIEQADPTIPVSRAWDDTDAETQRSAVEGVQGVLNGNTPEQSHDGWTRFKLENGWTLGPVKDEATKQHPLLVPYDDLPPSQRVKDHLFVAIVTTLRDAR
jgi:hypothetical protein